MNSSLTIDRKWLERYPLGSHPLLFLIFTESCFGMFVFLHFMMSRAMFRFYESAPVDYSVTWFDEMMYSRPWWALALGLIAGVVDAWLIRSIQERGLDADAGRYFLSKVDRSRELRTRSVRNRLVLNIGCIVISILGLVGVCALIGVNVKIAVCSSLLSFAIVLSPQKFAFHKEILRRRRIALAWEGIDPPDDRLTVRQKVNAGLCVAFFCGYMSACGYLAYILETHPAFDSNRASAYYNGAARIEIDDPL